jgi:hypothetical protein
MRLHIQRTLRFWVEAASKQEPGGRDEKLIPTLLEFEELGYAMRHIDRRGRIAWKATPKFLQVLADTERDAEDDLAEVP